MSTAPGSRRAEIDLLRDIVEHCPDALTLLDADGRVEYVSHAGRALFPADSAPSVGQHVEDLSPPIREQALILLEAMRRGDADRGDLDGFITRPDGSVRWTERRVQAIRHLNGTLRAVLVSTRDAHVRYLAEQRERARDEQLRFLTDRVHEMFWITDAKGAITYMSPGSFPLLGWTPEERIGLDFRHTGHSEGLLHAGRELFVSATRGEIDEATFEGEMRRKDGSFVWTETTARVERDHSGRIVGILHVTRDITTRREAERALREREEQLRFITDNTRDVIWSIDRDGVITYVSPSALRVFGRDPSERIGVHVTQTFHSTEFMKTGLELLAKAQRGEIDEVSFEGQQLRKDGSPVWVEVAGRIIRDAKGGMISGVMVTRDIDERKKTEALLEKQRFRLQQRGEELAEALRDLESFASMVSHDLQGPLRRIEALAAREASSEEDRRTTLQRIRDAARQGNAIVDGLLDLARYGTRALEVVDVDLSRDASDILDELADTDPHRGVSHDVAPGLRAKGDARLLHVVLRNLLTNAWKFTAAIADARIRVGVDLEADGPVFFVEDNGVGFDPVEVGRMFRPFVRVSERGEPGFGIGLSTVERIVHRHGGRVWATGIPGRGARFSFTLRDVRDADSSQ